MYICAEERQYKRLRYRQISVSMVSQRTGLWDSTEFAWWFITRTPPPPTGFFLQTCCTCLNLACLLPTFYLPPFACWAAYAPSTFTRIFSHNNGRACERRKYDESSTPRVRYSTPSLPQKGPSSLNGATSSHRPVSKISYAGARCNVMVTVCLLSYFHRHAIEFHYKKHWGVTFWYVNSIIEIEISVSVPNDSLSLTCGTWSWSAWMHSISWSVLFLVSVCPFVLA